MQFWGITDPGCVRPQNQDTYQMEQLDRNTLLCVVCDGMGGAKSGNVASTLAVEVFVEEFHGMGTTLVAMLISGKDVTVVNVGDSRAYRVSKDGIRRITTDHSLVQMMVQRGELTPELARTYPGKNYITRAIGTEAIVECAVFHLTVERGDCLLMCSDGLSNMMDDQEILFEVVHGVNKEQCCQRLLDIAKNRGAPDNGTCTMVLI